MPATLLSAIVKELSSRTGDRSPYRAPIAAAVATGDISLAVGGKTIEISLWQLAQFWSGEVCMQRGQIFSRVNSGGTNNTSTYGSYDTNVPTAPTASDTLPPTFAIAGIRTDITVPPGGGQVIGGTIQIGGAKTVTPDFVPITDLGLNTFRFDIKPALQGSAASGSIFILTSVPFGQRFMYTPTLLRATATAANEAVPQVTYSTLPTNTTVATTLLTRATEDIQGLLAWLRGSTDKAFYRADRGYDAFKGMGLKGDVENALADRAFREKMIDAGAE